MTNKKIAIIYDKWFDTLGGGEVVACYLAQHLLSKNYKVKIILGTMVNTDEIKNKIGVDLSKCEFIQIWNDEIELNKLTHEADLFINLTFMDYSIPSAKKNIYYAHFPSPEYNNIKSYVLNKLVFPFIYKRTKPIEILNNIPPVGLNRHLSYRLNQECTIAFSNQCINQESYITFFIFFEEFTKQSFENLSVVIKDVKILDRELKTDLNHNLVRYIYKVIPYKNTVYLKISADDNTYLVEPLSRPKIKYNLINKLIANWQAKARIGIFNNVNRRISTYDKIICHSDFVKGWILKYWGQVAKTLYPPVDLVNYSSKKQNKIVSVGRFFTRGHGKKQEVMIQAFKKVYKFYPNWELHLVGGASKDGATSKYLDELKIIAKNLPVFFHLNVSRQEVVKQLQTSKIYWHAGGYKEISPVKMEHFGIAPVEGISAGCLPILYNQGGLPEIIKLLGLPEKDHLFSNITELSNLTIKHIRNSNFLTAKQSEKTQLFSKLSFFKNLDKILNAI